MWQGRNDGDEVIHNRLFKCLDTSSNTHLLGFCSSLGVHRNQGRVGSELAPNIVRKNMGNFAIHDDFSFNDLGDIADFDNLEKGDELLYKQVINILKDNDYGVLIGGGHESSLAPIKAALDIKKSVGVVNFDAHFDVRKQPLHTSGNSFYMAYEYAKEKNYKYDYLCLGASVLSNTKALFNTMNEMNAKYVLDINYDNSSEIVKNFINNNDYIYISIDTDVFSLDIAPGVSAPSVYGINLKQALSVLKILFESQKVIFADICEFNPNYDVDNHTARLVAYLTYYLLRKGNIYEI